MIRRIGALAVLLAAALACLVGPAEAAAPPMADDDTQKIVYFGDDGPVLIELHLRINGRSFRSVWDECMAAVFAYADVKGRGVLTKEEAKQAPPVAALANNGGFVGGGAPGAPVSTAAGKDGKVTRRMLAEHYRTNGLPPFQLSFGSSSLEALALRYNSTAIGRDDNEADATNARLFKLLDKDGDGKLSRKELAAAPAVLGKLDADDDEMITVAELHGHGANSGDGTLTFVDVSGVIPGQANPHFHTVADGPSDPVLGQRLLERYGKKGSRTLTARAIRLDRKAFARLDRNEDGKLDAKELACFGQMQADLAFSIRFPGGQQVARVERHDMGRAVPAGVKVSATGGGFVIEMGNAQLELAGHKQGVFASAVFDSSQFYLMQFKMADKDDNGYLDKEEAKASPLFNALFAAMDRDGDGKLFEKEVVAYVKEMEKLRVLAARSCLSLTVTDQGKGLFEMADLDKDGRLSVRELRQMVKLVDKLDRDGDGKVSLAEIPRNYRGHFELGPAGSQGYSVIVVGGDFTPGSTTPAVRTRGPLWFRKMDSNNDGDVSRKEFLGTEAQFKAIDTDGDGLISVQEAEAFDKRMRAKKKE